MYAHIHTQITPHHTLSHIHIHGYTQTHTCTTNKHRHIYTHTHHTHTQIFTRYICFIHKHADKYHKFPPHTCNYVHISCLYHLIMENNLLKIFNHLFLSSISQKKNLNSLKFLLILPLKCSSTSHSFTSLFGSCQSLHFSSHHKGFSSNFSANVFDLLFPIQSSLSEIARCITDILTIVFHLPHESIKSLV